MYLPISDEQSVQSYNAIRSYQKQTHSRGTRFHHCSTSSFVSGKELVRHLNRYKGHQRKYHRYPLFLSRFLLSLSRQILHQARPRGIGYYAKDIVVEESKDSHQHRPRQHSVEGIEVMEGSGRMQGGEIDIGVKWNEWLFGSSAHYYPSHIQAYPIDWLQEEKCARK